MTLFQIRRKEIGQLLEYYLRNSDIDRRTLQKSYAFKLKRTVQRKLSEIYKEALPSEQSSVGFRPKTQSDLQNTMAAKLFLVLAVAVAGAHARSSGAPECGVDRPQHGPNPTFQSL